MATITFGAGSGNWQTDAAWVGGVKPTAADDVLLTAASGACTIDTGAVCRSLNLTGYTSTLTHNAGVTLTIGDATAGLSNIALEFPASGWTYTLNNASTSAISFISTSATQQTVNFAGKTVGILSFAGTGSSYQLTGSITNGASAYIDHTRGTLDINAQTLSVGSFLSQSNNTRVLTLGAANITITGGLYFWSISGSGLTFSGASATITTTAGSPTFAGGGNTYGSVVLSGGSISSITGANTFTNLTYTGAATRTDSLAVTANQTITGTLTINGNSTINRTLITSNVLGTPRTITATNAPVVTNADFRDITGAGAASWDLSAATGGSGNCGGNSLKALGDAAFTSAATQTATGTASFTWSTHGWTSRVPLPQDDVVINNAFIAGRTVTLDMPRAGKSISWTGATGTPAWAITTATTIYGSVTKIAGMTQSGSSIVTLEGRGAFTLTTAGTIFSNPITMDMIGGTLTLLDALFLTQALRVNQGTLDASTFNVTVTSSVTSNSGLTRTLKLGTGTWTLSGGGTVWNITSTGLTIAANTATLDITDTSQGTQKVFAGGGMNYNGAILRLSGKNYAVTGANTFGGIALNNLGDTTGLALPASTTTTVTTFTTTASAGNVAKLISSSGGTAATLSKSSGTVSVDYLSIQDSTATGGATWYAGANSTNVSGNSGWIFTAPSDFFPVWEPASGRVPVERHVWAGMEL